MEERRERRRDVWLETGRQIVDGVSGRRPGQRRSSLDLESVGRWVGDKVDWLLEEDDDWREPWQESTPVQAAAENVLWKRFRAGSPKHRQPRLHHLLMTEPLMRGPKTTASVSTAGNGAAWANRPLHRLGRMQRRWHPAVPHRDPVAAAVEAGSVRCGPVLAGAVVGRNAVTATTHGQLLVHLVHQVIGDLFGHLIEAGGDGR